jgi:hypothetical protein
MGYWRRTANVCRLEAVGVAFIGLLFAAALGVNVPLGIWRRGLRRFSPAWFVAIHASIPLLVAIRLALVRPNWVIPPEVALAVVGQLIGGRLPMLWDEGSES